MDYKCIFEYCIDYVCSEKLVISMLVISKNSLQIVHKNHLFTNLSVNWKSLLFRKSAYFIRSGMTWNSCCLEKKDSFVVRAYGLGEAYSVTLPQVSCDFG